MNASFLLCGILLAQPAAEPPIAGRPVDWSGIVGGPYVVTVSAEPRELTEEDRLTLTVQIVVANGGNVGNLRELKRPDIAKSETFKAFAVEDLDEHYAENPSRRWFSYLLRPRSSDVKEVPRLKLVYFNARAGRYQTTYSEALPLTIRSRTAPIAAVEVPPWIMQEWKAEEDELSRLLLPSSIERWRGLVGMGSDPLHDRFYPRAGQPLALGLVLTTPPLLAVVWYAIWRRRKPDEARAAKMRRSRAAAIALRTLADAGEDSPRHVRQAVEEYWRAKAGLPKSASTTPEVVDHIRGSSFSRTVPEEVGRLLQRCDDARFAPAPADTGSLIAEAKSLVLKWDEPV